MPVAEFKPVPLSGPRREVKKSLDSFSTNEFIEPTTACSRQFIKHREKLGLSDIIDIVEKIKFKWIPMKDVAREYRVSLQAIQEVMTKIRKNPQYIKELAGHKRERD